MLLLQLDFTHNWVQLFRDEVVKNFDQLVRHRVGQQLLAELTDEFFYFFALFVVAKGDRLAMRTGSRCSSNSVQIAFGLCWETEVEHGFNRGDIESSSNQVSRE